MPGSSTGRLFVVTTFGESHGPAVGCVVDGCPAGMPLDVAHIQAALDRRRPNQGRLTTRRKEGDRAELLAGVFEGRTLGTPICVIVRNEDADPRDYDRWRGIYRPSHADFTWDARFGHRDHRGGGRASARETVGRVAAGAIAERLLAALHGIEIVAWVDSVENIQCDPIDVNAITRAAVDANEVRCPDTPAAIEMIAAIDAARRDRDSVGGTIRCIARGVPAGLGEPVFDKLEADLAAACLSIPAAKAFESGSGFEGASQRGSEHNDLFDTDPAARIVTRSNRSGGIQGGISNGMPITMRVAFKPVATIPREQPTVDSAGRPARVDPRGRHDPCVLARAVPVVESMVAIVIADHALRIRTTGLS